MNKWNGLKLAAGCIASIMLSAIGAHATANGKKVIEFGYDQPTDMILHANITTMESAPFDGVVFGALGWQGPGGARRIDLCSSSWGSESFTRTEFELAVSNLKTTPFKKFTDNFLRLEVQPGNVDWYDDAGWNSIVNNVDLASWICQQGGVKGIFLDTEQYSAQVFYYQDQPNKSKYTFAQYQVKAYQRGVQYGKALTQELHNPVVMITWADSLLNLVPQDPLDWSDVGLMPSFLDGVVAGADSRAQFVDGLESAYAARDSADFARFKEAIPVTSKTSVDPSLYNSRMGTAFGIWLDQEGPTAAPWNPVDTSLNFFQPNEFGTAVYSALHLTDKYVWIYTENVDWWTNTGVSQPYISALQSAETRH